MTNRVHFIGIGGTGISAIAKVLVEKGWQVSGSDRSASSYTDEMGALGVKVFFNHAAANIGEIDFVVRSSAIPDDNIEVITALEKGQSVLKRVDFLPQVIGDQSWIAVAGTHGKTTTTAMIASILMDAGMDPSFIIGSVSKNLGTNAHAGKGDYFVIEADEYDSMFLGLHPTLAVITNIEHDHPDCYPTPEVYSKAFVNFLANLKPRGIVVLGADNPGCMSLKDQISVNIPVQTFSAYSLLNRNPFIDQQNADYLLIQKDDGSYSVSLQEALHFKKEILSLKLGVPGIHNLQNGMAAAVAALIAGVDPEVISRSLAEFRGTGRRFEIMGEINGITLVDDYAHHPTEIRATLQAARMAFPGRRLWTVWQPHTYSRTQTLLTDYIEAISQSDQIVITEVFAAREKSTGFSAAQIAESVINIPVTFAPSLDFASNYLEEHLQPGDVVLVLSAGDATQINLTLLKSPILLAATASQKALSV
ncbi:MAG: UDP-N-acetylmuramate--L-alanine ligase [Leptolinea sp.]